MRVVIPILLVFASSACASRGADGEWPSLAYRPGENVLQGPCDPRGTQTADMISEAKPADVMLPPTVPSDASLTALESSLAEIEAEWAAQAARTETAVAAAAGRKEGPVWGGAQIALSRLEAVYGRAAPLETRMAALLAEFMSPALIPDEVARLDARLTAFRARHLERLDRLRTRVER